jgi:hypothetical protein
MAAARVMGRLGLAALVVAAAACSSGTKDLFGRGKSAPDEFAVFARAPLSLPPGYGDRPTAAQPLPPPGGASDRAALVLPQDEARNAMLGNRSPRPLGVTAANTAPGTAPATVTPPAAASPGTLALLQRTGATQSNPDIRAAVNRETQLLAEADQTFVERLMFWSSPTEYGTVVNAAAETRRIQEAQALGEPIVAGPTPTIERKRKALLEDLVDWLQ